MPPMEEFAECLHKIKYGFNLLVRAINNFYIPGRSVMNSMCHSVSVVHENVCCCCLWQGELNGRINNPSAPEFVHALFSSLAFVSQRFSWIWIIQNNCHFEELEHTYCHVPSHPSSKTFISRALSRWQNALHCMFWIRSNSSLWKYFFFTPTLIQLAVVESATLPYVLLHFVFAAPSLYVSLSEDWLWFSSAGDSSLSQGSATDHCDSAADTSVHPPHEWRGVCRGGPAVAVSGRRLEHPQVGRQTVWDSISVSDCLRVGDLVPGW